MRLSAACRGLERRRLMDLGIVPGTRVGLERRGLTGGLSAYRVRGTVIGLREEQARMIGVTHREASRRQRVAARARGHSRRGYRMNVNNECPPTSCAGCQHHVGNLVKLGVDMERFDYVVALAGNPNTGKSTVFNALTGLRQHTGNWPGKTVARAEGGFALRRVGATSWWICPARTRCCPPASTRRSRATSSSSASPTSRVVVVDADAAGAQSQPRAAGARDHRSRRGLPESDGRGPAASACTVDDAAASHAIWASRSCRRRRDTGKGMPRAARDGDRRGGHRPETVCRPHRLARHDAAGDRARGRPSWPKRSRRRSRGCRTRAGSRCDSWTATRRIDRGAALRRAGRSGTPGRGRRRQSHAAARPCRQRMHGCPPPPRRRDDVVALASSGEDLGPNFHESLVEAIYTEAARIADRASREPATAAALRPRPHARRHRDQPVAGLSR